MRVYVCIYIYVCVYVYIIYSRHMGMYNNVCAVMQCHIMQLHNWELPLSYFSAISTSAVLTSTGNGMIEEDEAEKAFLRDIERLESHIPL